nr:LysR substrate-binding domain-containing protein [Mesorhizobium sp.]
MTDSGAAYVAACKRILEQVGKAERTASGEYNAPKDDLIITAPVVFGRLHVLPAINDFLSHFPDINVRLVLSDRNVNLIDDHIDMAVRIGPLPDSSWLRHGWDPFVGWSAAVRPTLLAVGLPRAPADLSSVSCVTFDVLASTTSSSFATPGSMLSRP